MRLILSLVLLFGLALPVAAEAQAIVDPLRTIIAIEGRDRGKPRPVEVTLGLSQAVPYRVALIDQPPRLVIDLADTAVPSASADASDKPLALRWGPTAEGGARAVMTLPGPMAVKMANISGEAPALTVRLEPVAPEVFAPSNSLTVLRGLPQPAETGDGRTASALADGRLRVVLDPGHGGIDSGAKVGEVREAAVMLAIAQELATVLQAQGIEVVLTRDEDKFVPLEHRTTVARAKAADLFISLHADALPAGEAAGVTIYTWDPQSNDRAARQLAMLHDRSDLLAGLDLSNTDEDVSRALMDLARLGTQPRSQAAAGHLVSEMNVAGVTLHRVPMRGAAFSVLKSPDIPSLLIELGFLTDPGDRANLLDAEWRRRVTGAIATGIRAWAKDDTALAQSATNPPAAQP